MQLTTDYNLLQYFWNSVFSIIIYKSGFKGKYYKKILFGIKEIIKLNKLKNLSKLITVNCQRIFKDSSELSKTISLMQTKKKSRPRSVITLIKKLYYYHNLFFIIDKPTFLAL